MKTIITILTAALITTSFSKTIAQQTFTLSQMETLYQYRFSFANFERYVMQKGYSLSESENGKKVYLGDKVRLKGEKDQITKWSDGDFMFITPDKQCYLDFEDSLTKRGYASIKSRENEKLKTTEYYYSNGKIEFSINTFVTNYGIALYSVFVTTHPVPK